MWEGPWNLAEQSLETRNSPDDFHTPGSDIKRQKKAINWEIVECCTMDQAAPSFSWDHLLGNQKHSLWCRKAPAGALASGPPSSPLGLACCPPPTEACLFWESYPDLLFSHVLTTSSGGHFIITFFILLRRKVNPKKTKISLFKIGQDEHGQVFTFKPKQSKFVFILQVLNKMSHLQGEAS